MALLITLIPALVLADEDEDQTQKATTGRLAVVDSIDHGSPLTLRNTVGRACKLPLRAIAAPWKGAYGSLRMGGRALLEAPTRRGALLFVPRLTGAAALAAISAAGIFVETLPLTLPPCLDDDDRYLTRMLLLGMDLYADGLSIDPNIVKESSPSQESLANLGALPHQILQFLTLEEREHLHRILVSRLPGSKELVEAQAAQLMDPNSPEARCLSPNSLVCDCMPYGTDGECLLPAALKETFATLYPPRDTEPVYAFPYSGPERLPINLNKAVHESNIAELNVALHTLDTERDTRQMSEAARRSPQIIQGVALYSLEGTDLLGLNPLRAYDVNDMVLSPFFDGDLDLSNNRHNLHAKGFGNRAFVTYTNSFTPSIEVYPFESEHFSVLVYMIPHAADPYSNHNMDSETFFTWVDKRSGHAIAYQANAHNLTFLYGSPSEEGNIHISYEYGASTDILPPPYVVYDGSRKQADVQAALRQNVEKKTTKLQVGGFKLVEIDNSKALYMDRYLYRHHLDNDSNMSFTFDDSGKTLIPIIYSAPQTHALSKGSLRAMTEYGTNIVLRCASSEAKPIACLTVGEGLDEISSRPYLLSNGFHHFIGTHSEGDPGVELRAKIYDQDKRMEERRRPIRDGIEFVMPPVESHFARGTDEQEAKATAPWGWSYRTATDGRDPLAMLANLLGADLSKSDAQAATAKIENPDLRRLAFELLTDLYTFNPLGRYERR